MVGKIPNINQTKSMGAKGDQTITINNNEQKHFYVKQKGYDNLVKTHVGNITFDPISLRDVIITIDKVSDGISKSPTDFKTIDIEKKNKLNGLTQYYYDNIIAQDFEPYFNELDNFLKLRENEDLQKKVGNIASSLNRKILINREEFNTFEKILLQIEDSLIDSQFQKLQGMESVVNLFLYYLYANCLIGKKSEEENSC